MRIRLSIPPGELAVNGRHIPQFLQGKPTGRIISSSTYRAALDHATLLVRQACIRAGWKTTRKQCRVTIVTHWPTSAGDRDSVCKAVCDSLQHGGVVVNDKQCGPIVLDATWRSREPGVDVEIEELPE